MLQSAYILPLVPRLDWAKAVAPGPTLGTVAFDAALDVGQYAGRDRELAYRDLLVGAAIAQVALKTSDIWDFRAPRPALPYPAAGALQNAAVDLPPTVGFPGTVDHVDNQSLPVNAAATDQQLYARDLLIYEALQQAAEQLADNPLPADVLPGLATSDLWALAYGISQGNVDAGYNLPLAPGLFSSTDQFLAWRDNVLAAYVAATVNNLGNVYAVASRLLVQVAGPNAAEPEVYALVSDDGRFRTWAAQPLVPGRLQLVFDRTTQTLSWAGEDLSDAGGPSPTATSFSSAFNSTVTVIYDVPGYLDAEYWRQKSARVNVRPWKDRTLFLTALPNNFVTSGGLYQSDSVLLPVAGSATFGVPAQIPASCVRVGLTLQPSTDIDILGFQNLEGSANGTAVTYYQGGTHSWQFPLPAGTLFFSLTFRDDTAQTLSFNLSCAYNGVAVFDGSLVYNQPAGTPVTSQLVQLNSPGGPGLFTVTWDGAAGQFTLDEISFFTQAASGQQVLYTVQVGLGGYSSYPLTLAGVPGRVDAAWFDVCVTSALTQPTLTVSWSGGTQICLYVFAYDVRVFDTVETLPNPLAYDPYKQLLVQRAMESVQRSAAATQTTPPTDYRTLDPATGDHLWDAAANGAWLRAISLVETRLAQAFQLGGPGDVGRLALVPAGLQLDQGTRVLATDPNCTPVLRTFQAWMNDFGAVVAGPDFLPLVDNGCASQGLQPFTADFSAVPSAFGQFATEPTIVDIAAVSHYPGSPDGNQPLAYTVANPGPAGGTLSQTVDWTVTCINLTVGDAYTITATLSTYPLDGSLPPVLSNVYIYFTATTTTQQASGATIGAAEGYAVEIKSATVA